ncbi:MAG: folylpolyglutamate synthase/dihydrofolate synthase family protein [Bacteroidota bacterium]|nr:folylpolyglutamate synthase/dihydrofolate synthase family protein [Bacteroidota bacterium]
MDDTALSYADTVDWLFLLQFVGIKMGLDNIRTLAMAWDNPQRRYPVVHIAGTNGKGSTACSIASALQAAGYRTGLYTSPHLVDFSERIRVDGVPIPAEIVVAYAHSLRSSIERLNATFFEATTLMAFHWFAEQKVDVAVVETGLGGRLDATNIVDPVLSVITSLSLEHREFLGETIEEIAREKGGIIKSGVPVVTSVRQPAALRVLSDIAQQREATLLQSSAEARVLHVDDLDRMFCRVPDFDLPVEVALVGAHQVENAALALTALERLRERGFVRLGDAAMRRGLREVRARTGLRGRLERLHEAPELVIDVGHNPDGVRALLAAWCALRAAGDTDLLLGVLEHKDLQGMLSHLTHFSFRSITLIEAASHEARSLESMQRDAEAAGLQVQTTANSADWFREKVVRNVTGSVLMFGSHYVVGAFLREWPEKMQNGGLLP